MQKQKPFLFARQPLSALSKVTAYALFASGAVCTFLWAVTAHALGLGIISLAQLLVAALILFGVGWFPLLGSVMGAIIIEQFAGEPYVALHLSQPKELFIFFVFIIIIFACSFVAVGSGIAATVQNYRQRDRSTRRAPRWLAATLTGVGGMVVGAILIGALVSPNAPAPVVAANGVPTVHVGASNFDQSSITIQKGSKLVVVDDGSYVHILANGRWVNGQPQKAQEPGAPAVNNMQLSGSSVEIGPFNMAGTFHIYCEVHPGMNLTVIVQ